MCTVRILPLALCLFLVAGPPPSARADEAKLEQCLAALDGLDFMLEFELGRTSDDCEARGHEALDFIEAIRDLRLLRYNTCDPDEISGGGKSPEEIEELLKEVDEEADALQRELDDLQVELKEVCARPPETFIFEVCNRDSETAWVAVAHRTDRDGGDRYVEGWWRVEPGDCRSLGPFLTGWFFYYAYSAGGSWPGDHRLCVTFSKFKRVDYADSSYTCDADELKRFNQKKIDKAEFTWTLRP